MKTDEATLILTIKVKYELGCTDVRELERVLVAAADHLHDNGLLTDDDERSTEASVLAWESYVTRGED